MQQRNIAIRVNDFFFFFCENFTSIKNVHILHTSTYIRNVFLVLPFNDGVPDDAQKDQKPFKIGKTL